MRVGPKRWLVATMCSMSLRPIRALCQEPFFEPRIFHPVALITQIQTGKFNLLCHPSRLFREDVPGASSEHDRFSGGGPGCVVSKLCAASGQSLSGSSHEPLSS